MELNHPVIKSVMVPYEGTTLPAHYYQLNDTNEPKPVLILLTGFDGTKEEFYGLAMTALEHGMNCLAIEGPGQGEVVKKQHLYFRYDYEAIVTPAVDYLLANEEVDPEKIVLWGESFGGYLAPRAAAFEHRLAACIANSGIFCC
ncbi:alpha/beta hydrolase [Clostridium drakei]|uniref:Alpha/beta hydrolase n=1 Tax=Clostridium drakei TaxID=332101 RepID=A0A2U8DLG6_9CLOT|nr:alpha/beta hydrolase [Clostridium drakei]